MEEDTAADGSERILFTGTFCNEVEPFAVMLPRFPVRKIVHAVKQIYIKHVSRVKPPVISHQC